MKRGKSAKGAVRKEVQDMVERIHVDEGRESKRTKTAVLTFVDFLIASSRVI